MKQNKQTKTPLQLWRVIASCQWCVCGQASSLSWLLREALINSMSSRVKKLERSRLTGGGIENSLLPGWINAANQGPPGQHRDTLKALLQFLCLLWLFAHCHDKLTPPTLGERPGFAANKMWDSTIVSIPDASHRNCSLKGALFQPLAVAKTRKMGLSNLLRPRWRESFCCSELQT